MVSEQQVKEKLEDVKDPEFDINIVDMGLVYEVNVEDEDVHILMTLTTRGCPFHGIFEEVINQELSELEGIGEIEVELTFDPPWTMEKMTDEGRNKMGAVPGHGMGF
ncbi:metal-sulfur cluster assembly factor [Candidatus Nanohalococcus occultus]|uniref:metal-sulfur cluster assembly factor n=1 Tax=Candidatus Nanohalococcus occultus TaxID=2978047 RepID=UPI0039E09C57